MAGLTGSTIGASYKRLLITTNTNGINGTQTVIQDGIGNNTALSLATGGATVGGTLGVTGISTLTGNTVVGASLNVTGVATLSNNASVGGNLSVTGTSLLSGNTTVSGTLGVTGLTTVSALTVAGAFTSSGSATFTNLASAGTLSSTGNFSVATTKFTVAASTGDTSVGGALGVTGASTLSGNLTVGSSKFTADATTGNTVVAGTLGVTGASTLNQTTVSSQNLLRFQPASGATFASIRAPSTVATSYTLTLPSAQGAASTVLTNDGSGNLSWAAGGGGGGGSSITAGDSSVSVTDTGANGTITTTVDGIPVGTWNASSFTVGNAFTSTGNFTVGASKLTVASSTGNTVVGGTLSSTGDFSVATNKFNVAALTGNTTVAGTLGAGATTLSSLAVTGASTHNQTNLLLQSPLRFEDASTTKYVGIRAPTAVGTSYTLNLPANQGASSTVLTNDGAGNLSWASGGGGGGGSSISAGDTSVSISDTGANGTITTTIDGTSRGVWNASGFAVSNGTLTSNGNFIVGSAYSVTASSGDVLTTGAITSADHSVNGSLTVGGVSNLLQTVETLSNKTGATGVVAHSFLTATLWYHSSIAANFTANFTSVPTTNNRSLVFTLILAQGGTAYIPNAVQIDGVAQTINWLNSTVPVGTAGKKEIVSFTCLRVGSAWTVLGSLTSHG
jgi:hypothetical protein